MPVLETDRLLVRPLALADLDAVYRIYDVELADSSTGGEHGQGRERRESWLRWTVAGYEELARLYQFPLGDRGVALKETGELIGLAGYTPALMPFGQVAGLGQAPAGRASLEVGLFWAISPRHQGRGYASEAARALVEFAFGAHGLWRIVATTEHGNAASQRVMEKIGMALHRNPLPTPPYFQVVGVLEQAA